jgi:hypothetical protein
MYVKFILSSLASLFLAGCIGLKEVRDYAAESAKLASYKELTDHFAERYNRERPFLGSAPRLCSEEIELALHERRQAAYPDLIKIHDSVAAYMATLATLAGDKAFDLREPISNLSTAIKEHPDFGVTTEQVDAYTKLVQMLVGLGTRALQQRAIRNTIEAADPPIQKLLLGMEEMLNAYATSSINERGCVAGNLEIEAARSQNLLTRILGKQLAAEKSAEYDALDETITKARVGVIAVRDGHAKLKKNVSKLTAKEVSDELKRLSKEIQAARKALAKLD